MSNYENIPNRAACSSAFQKLELSKTLPDHFFLTYPYCYSIGQDLLCQQETFLLTSDSGWGQKYARMST